MPALPQGQDWEDARARIYASALDEALRAGSGVVAPVHLEAAALVQPEVRQLLDAVGTTLDEERMHSQILAIKAQPAIDPGGEVRLTEETSSVLAMLYQHRFAGGDSATLYVALLLKALLTREECRQVASQSGLDIETLSAFLNRIR